MTKISEDHLLPSQAIINIFDNLSNLSDSDVSLDMALSEYVDIDQSYVEIGHATLDLDNKNFEKTIKNFESEVNQKIDLSLSLLSDIISVNFEEKIELFNLAMETDLNLQFPIKQWYKNRNLKNGEKYLNNFDLTVERYGVENYTKNIESIITYVIKSESFNSSILKLLEGNVVSNDTIDLYLEKLDKESWVFIDKQTSNKLSQYLFLKEFNNDCFNLTSDKLKELSNIFNVHISNVLLNEIKKTSKSKSFFMKIKDESKLSYNEMSDILESSLIMHFTNIRKNFPEFYENESFPKKMDETITHVFKSFCYNYSKNVNNNIIEIMKDKIKLEMLIPESESNVVIKKSIKF